MDRETAEPAVTTLPGEHANRRVEAHHRVAAPSTYVYEFVWDSAAEADGPFCTDVDGNVLMDFTSHVAAAPLGYNNPKIVDRLAEFDLIDPLKIAGQDFYVAGDRTADGDRLPGPTELMNRLVDVTAHYDMDTVFLSNSGAEAVENALKICYDARNGGKYAITFEGAFHGRTLGALSINRSKEVYRRHFPELSTVHDVPFCTDRHCTAATCTCGFFVDGVSQLRRTLDADRGHVNPDEVSYVIVEPIQGEGGYRFPSDAFVEELAGLLEEHDIPLIADEIQSGLGRTGEMWAVDHYPLEPDVISAGKALRVGATISRSDVFPADPRRLSSTWGGGDLLASLQGSLTIDAIFEHDLLANATDRGRQFIETVRDADPVGVTDVRGKGLLLAVQFGSKSLRDDVQEAAFKRGFLTLGCGYDVLRLLPPLDVTEREIELGAELLLASIDDAN
ncbi:MAG: aminotransferase class III-fold pyridoxal phosphate-dependent enzyme [Halobacteriota archaeon]